MTSTPHTLALASSHAATPLWARAILWTTFAICLLMALSIGIMMIAGNNSKLSHPWRYFTLAFLATLIAQGGYLLAPFAIGRSWWLWSFTWTLPIALLVLMTMCVPLFGALTWTRPDGASGWKTLANTGWFTAIAFVLYLMPPILVWMHRPIPAK